MKQLRGRRALITGAASGLGRQIALALAAEGVHLWLLIERSSDDEELRLYCLLDLLDERYPAADVQLHVLNPASFTIDLHEALPQDAEKIFSRVA